ncbi:MAG: tripartite tricarboxylate transporter substrate binding protein [Betaproteobacteria bacterium]|nr:tripartite tricarboxylate transporter substrate binding protein [Betaproteobacteria bacterium]
MKAGLKGVIAAALAAASLGAQAQGYPVKAVTMIVAFTPGSAVDIVGRIVADKLSQMWGQPVVPENRSGAGGSIGSAVVARAAPDGYTLLVTSNAHAINPAIYAKLPYDTLKDFTDIALFVEQPNVMIVNADSRYRTLMDVVTAAKAKPGSLNLGHAGIGSGTHLSTERFIAATGIQVAEIPFKGTPEVVAAMLSGNVDGYWAPISAALSFVKGGKVRALAVSTGKRNPTMPEVPTIAEAGVKNAESALWVALWGPAGMSPELVNKINADARKAVSDSATKAKLESLGNTTADLSAPEFARLVREELETTRRLLQAAGVKPQ